MGIEVRGGCAHSYVVAFSARREKNGRITITHDSIIIPANSVDEATGKALRIARMVFPQENRWEGHFIVPPIQIDQISWVGEFDMSKIVVAD